MTLVVEFLGPLFSQIGDWKIQLKRCGHESFMRANSQTAEPQPILQGC
jgi:hypothetical protein